MAAGGWGQQRAIEPPAPPAARRLGRADAPSAADDPPAISGEHDRHTDRPAAESQQIHGVPLPAPGPPDAARQAAFRLVKPGKGKP